MTNIVYLFCHKHDNFKKSISMLITVFGATGQVGSRVVKQALAKGHTVRAFGRNVIKLIDEDERNDSLEAIHGYIFEEKDVYNAVKGTNAVISALGGSFDGTDKTRSLGIKNIIQQMNKANIQHIVALGGFGVLNAPDGTYIVDQPDYPPQYLPVGKEHLQAYLYLKDSNLEWTFVCSPDIKDKDASFQYHTSDNFPPTPNNSYINAGDLADFMIQEVEQPAHVKQRVGISGL
jgi:putative NADH-flavin reductase